MSRTSKIFQIRKVGLRSNQRYISTTDSVECELAWIKMDLCLLRFFSLSNPYRHTGYKTHTFQSNPVGLQKKEKALLLPLFCGIDWN